MGRFVAAALLACFAVLGTAASRATADPSDHVPYCSGDQTPMDYACRVAPSQVVTHGEAGTSPDLPFGTNPGDEPVI